MTGVPTLVDICPPKSGAPAGRGHNPGELRFKWRVREWFRATDESFWDYPVCRALSAKKL